MSKLKELTWENHQNAERTAFARRLMGGITPEEYHTYLYNQFLRNSLGVGEYIVLQLHHILKRHHSYKFFCER